MYNYRKHLTAGYNPYKRKNIYALAGNVNNGNDEPLEKMQGFQLDNYIQQMQQPMNASKYLSQLPAGLIPQKATTWGNFTNALGDIKAGNLSGAGPMAIIGGAMNLGNIWSDSSTSTEDKLAGTTRELGYTAANFIPGVGPAVSAGLRLADKIGGGVQNALSGGYSSDIDDKIKSITKFIPGAQLGATALISAGLNRVYGSKLNQEKINEIQNQNVDVSNQNTLGTTNASLLNDFGNMDWGDEFSKSDVGKDASGKLFGIKVSSGGHKAEDKYNELKWKQENARSQAMANFNNRVREVNQRDAHNALMNFMACGGRLFDDGGSLFGNDLVFDNNLMYVNEGGTHEQSPYDGVPISYDEQGTPNLVEEGEVVYGHNYVFSDRLKVPDDLAKRLGVTKGKTFAKAVRELSKESEELPNDPIIKRGLEDGLQKLAVSQEQLRNEMQEREYAEGWKHDFGGNLFEVGGPMTQKGKDNTIFWDETGTYQKNKNGKWVALTKQDKDGYYFTELRGGGRRYMTNEGANNHKAKLSYGQYKQNATSQGMTPMSFNDYKEYSNRPEDVLTQGLTEKESRQRKDNRANELAETYTPEMVLPFLGTAIAEGPEGLKDWGAGDYILEAASVLPAGRALKPAQMMGKIERGVRATNKLSKVVAASRPANKVIKNSQKTFRNQSRAADRAINKMIKPIKNSSNGLPKNLSYIKETPLSPIREGLEGQKFTILGVNDLVKSGKNLTKPTITNIKNTAKATKDAKVLNDARVMDKAITSTKVAAAKIDSKIRQIPVNLKSAISKIKGNRLNYKEGRKAIISAYNEDLKNITRSTKTSAEKNALIKKLNNDYYTAMKENREIASFLNRNRKAVSTLGVGALGYTGYEGYKNGWFTGPNEEFLDSYYLNDENDNFSSVNIDDGRTNYLWNEPNYIDENINTRQQNEQPLEFYDESPAQTTTTKTQTQPKQKVVNSTPKQQRSTNGFNWEYALGGNLFNDGGKYLIDEKFLNSLKGLVDYTSNSNTGRLGYDKSKTGDINEKRYKDFTDYIYNNWGNWGDNTDDVYKYLQSLNDDYVTTDNNGNLILNNNARSYKGYWDTKSGKYIIPDGIKALDNGLYHPKDYWLANRIDPLWGRHHYTPTLLENEADTETDNGTDYEFKPNQIRGRGMSVLYDTDDPNAQIYNTMDGDTVVTHVPNIDAPKKEDLQPLEELPLDPLSNLKYAPALGSVVNLMENRAKGPDFTYANQYDNLAKQLGEPVTTPVDVIGDYRQRNPFDERYLVNLNNQNANAYARTGQNISGGNRAAQLGYASAGNFQRQQNQGKIMSQAYTANREDDAKVAEFNRGTNQYNATANNTRNNMLAQLNSQRNMTSLQGRMNAARLRQNIQDEYDTAINQDKMNIWDTLGNIGNETNEENQIRRLINWGVIAPAPEYLKRMQKSNTTTTTTDNTKSNSDTKTNNAQTPQSSQLSHVTNNPPVIHDNADYGPIGPVDMLQQPYNVNGTSQPINDVRNSTHDYLPYSDNPFHFLQTRVNPEDIVNGNYIRNKLYNNRALGGKVNKKSKKNKRRF